MQGFEVRIVKTRQKGGPKGTWKRLRLGNLVIETRRITEPEVKPQQLTVNLDAQPGEILTMSDKPSETVPTNSYIISREMNEVLV